MYLSKARQAIRKERKPTTNSQQNTWFPTRSWSLGTRIKNQAQSGGRPRELGIARDTGNAEASQRSSSTQDAQRNMPQRIATLAQRSAGQHSEACCIAPRRLRFEPQTQVLEHGVLIDVPGGRGAARGAVLGLRANSRQSVELRLATAFEVPEKRFTESRQIVIGLRTRCSEDASSP